jgi:aspartyl protease family protein
MVKCRSEPWDIPAMRSILVFAILALAIGAVVPRLYVRDTPAAVARAALIPPVSPEPAAGGRSVTLNKADNGHFQTDAVVDGRRIDFLVDTGASVIALRQRDAARLGIHPTPRDYTAKVSTANGLVKAAPIELNRVEVGGLSVRNVAALVLPDEALATNLLGMSFLSRVRWEHRNGRLVLEQ